MALPETKIPSIHQHICLVRPLQMAGYLDGLLRTTRAMRAVVYVKLRIKCIVNILTSFDTSGVSVVFGC